MLRAFGFVLAVSVIAPASALACGMYIPEPEEKMTLASVLDSIDEVVKPQDAKPEVVNAEADPDTATVVVEEPTKQNRRGAKRHKTES
jgi:hypothetical protein